MLTEPQNNPDRKDNDPIRERIRARSRKAALNNILIIILLIALFAAIIFAKNTYHALHIAYNEKDSLNKLVALEKNAADSAFARLKVRDSANVALMQKAAGTSKEAQKLLAPVITDRDSARDHARRGYDSLKKRSFSAALAEFEASENFYNGYHDSYEVARLLRKNKNGFNDPATQKSLLNEIYTQYNSLERIKSSDIK